MCSGSEEGSYLRLIDLVYHSTLGLRVIPASRRPAAGPGMPGRIPKGTMPPSMTAPPRPYIYIYIYIYIYTYIYVCVCV